MLRLSKAKLPFYGVMVGVLLLLTYIPQLSTWLPVRRFPRANEEEK